MSIYHFVNIIQEGHIRHLGHIRHSEYIKHSGHIRHSEYIRHLGHIRQIYHVNMQSIKKRNILLCGKAISKGANVDIFLLFFREISNCNFLILKSLQPDVADVSNYKLC